MKISRLGEAPDYRFSLANERTFLAWIRTALGFLAAGVGLDQLAPDFATPVIREALALLLCLFAGGLAIYGYLRWLRNEKAMRLKEDMPYTNSLLIINEAVSRDCNMNLLMPGGTYRKRSSSFHGGLAEQAFRAFTFDKLFIGADGFDIEQGTTTFNEAYQVSQAMCQAAKQIIVVTDSSKFGRKTPNVVVPIDKIDIVITDHGISEADQAALEQRGIQVLLV